MTSLYTLAVETALAGDGAQAAQASSRCAASGEDTWRQFRERLLQDAEGAEWSSQRQPQTVSSIMAMTQQALDASSCTIYLKNGHGLRVFHESRTGPTTRRRTQSRIDTLSGPAAWVVTERRPLLLNTREDWGGLGLSGGSRYETPDNRLVCVPIEADKHVLGAIEVSRGPADAPFTQHDIDSAGVIGAMAGMAIENSRLRQSMEESFRSTIRALASAIDAKDPYTCGHSQSVAQYSLVGGMVLGLTDEAVRTLETAALLHDIGKIGIDDAILRKPRRLTPAEHAIIKDHPVIGAAIVHDIGSLSEVISLILHHHEAYDGSGYPHGLAGEDIPLGARVIAVADAFDSMTTDRPYRRGMTINEAMTELHRCRGTQFCPVALDAFAVGFTRYYDDLPRRPRVLERFDNVAVPAW